MNFLVTKWVNNQAKIINQKIHNYLASESFERDLDGLLSSFQTYYCDEESFENIKNRKFRIKSKLDYLKKKSALYIGEGAVIGFKAGALTLDARLITTSTLIGASAHAGQIGYNAAEIILHRIKEGHVQDIFDLDFAVL